MVVTVDSSGSVCFVFDHLLECYLIAEFVRVSIDSILAYESGTSFFLVCSVNFISPCTSTSPIGIVVVGSLDSAAGVSKLSTELFVVQDWPVKLRLLWGLYNRK